MTVDTTGPASVDVHGVVHAPIEDVWALFRPFGPDIMKWWPIYDTMELEAPGEDVVGAVRAFRTKTGRNYRERLVARDDGNKTETYDMLSVEPSVPTFKGATTKVSFTDGGDGATHVRWRSWSDASALILGKIKSTQEAVYAAAIDSLNRHFHPALGTVDVVIVRARELDNHSMFPVDAYVVVELDDGPTKLSKTHHFTSHPVFNQALKFDVLEVNGKLSFAVWDQNIGHDAPLGHCSLDLHSLTSGVPKTIDLDLIGNEGSGGKLSIEITLRLKDGDTLAPTETQAKLHHMAVIEGALKKLQTQAMQLAQQAGRGPTKTWGYARYPRAPALPDVPLEDLPRMVVGLPPEEALPPEKIGRMVSRAVEYLYSQSQFMERAETVKDPYLAYFGGWIEEPTRLVTHYREDTEMARQCLSGVNPMVITAVTQLSQIPKTMRGVEAQGKSVETLLNDKRLFILDYEALASLKPYRDMVFYAPYMLLYREDCDDGTSRMNIAAIQLERADDAHVYTPQNTPTNRWLFAKIQVACADNQYHQWLFHLGFGHLGMEPLAVAWHNALPSEHVLHKLLAPHFRDTIGINFLARQTLVSDVAPFTDHTFSTGTAQALEMFMNAWKQYDFFARSFPADLKTRGFDEAGTDGVEEYHFRDDGFLIWNAIGDYVTQVVEASYANDDAVTADPVIAAWATECSAADKADIPGFPSTIASRALLAKTLQTLIWAVSAQHSVVNFPQVDYLSYVPNRPDSLFARMPEGNDEITMETIFAALPGPMISHFQISFCWILTAPSHHPMSTVDAMAELHPDVHASFQKRLAEISQSITARNEALVKAGKAPYPYLLPERIASSIAI